MTTLQAGATTPIILTGPTIGPADYEKERKAYWAGLFRSLGDVMHLVQDMGQPQ